MRHPHARIALLLVSTLNLRFINNEVVADSERRLAQQFPAECAALVRGGWLPSLPPPSQADVVLIRKGIVEERWASDRARKATAASAVYEKPKPQSEVYAQRLDDQNTEIQRLEERIAVLSKQ
jgi:hypothetical protein